MVLPMTTPKNPRRTLYGCPPGSPQLVRYRIPAGLAEEVLREGQRRKMSGSAVVAAVLTQRLSGFTADGVTERLEDAVRAFVATQACEQCPSQRKLALADEVPHA